MRVITYMGTEHRLSERNWKQMVNRFNAEKARINTYGYKFIPVKSICVMRSYKCIRCPLRDPHKKTNSCTYLFDSIIGDDLLKYIHMRDSGIFWDSKDDERARTALKKVTEVLLKAEKTDGKRKVKEKTEKFHNPIQPKTSVTKGIKNG